MVPKRPERLSAVSKRGCGERSKPDNSLRAQSIIISIIIIRRYVAQTACIALWVPWGGTSCANGRWAAPARSHDGVVGRP